MRLSSFLDSTRILICLLVTFCSTALCSADELSVRVLDPQSAVVNRARVALYPQSSSTPLAVLTTSGQGLATFGGLSSGSYSVEVLAAGFAARNVKVTLPETPNLTVQLSLSSVAQAVEVSTARTPLPTDESAASISQLSGNELKLLQPLAEADALRVMPGAIVSGNGRNGGLTSLFVRGGESRYNKVLIDDVPVNEPGGSFDFGTVSMEQVDRLEFVRGAESTLYGADAMTSVVQVWTRNGSTRIPELRFGAEGGSFESARGFASLAGARGRFDYNLFGEQTNTNGQGINDAYSNSTQGANIGVQLAPAAFFRFRTRHSNARTGVPSFWNFNGQPLLPPDSDQYARQNNFLASAELSFAAPSRWQHRVIAYEYNHRRTNVDSFMDPGRGSIFMGEFSSFDYPFDQFANINRAGLDYQGEYWLRDWSRATFGYQFEDENGWVGDRGSGSNTHGLRRNHAVYGQQILTLGRASLIAGLRFEHNESFGDKAIPRIAATYLVARGSHVLSGTRLRFAFGTGISAPTFQESFGIGAFNIDPNPELKAQENRSWESGVQQLFLNGKLAATATYFSNQFKNQIDFITVDPATFEGKYINVNRSMAHGAELMLVAQAHSHLTVQGGYTYLSSQILDMPLCGVFCDPLKAPGAPFVRRPKHSGTLLATWSTTRWGASVGGAFVGRRPDSDFMGLQPPVTYAAGYARVDLGFWRIINRYMTAYANFGNVLNRHYEEVAGYPALRANFRAGMRFRIGGE